MLLFFIASSLFFVSLVVVNIAVVDDRQVLSTSCISASNVGNRRWLFEHLKRKKTTSSSDVRLAKNYANASLTSRKKKMRLTRSPSISCCCFLYRFSYLFLSSFPHILRLLLPYSCDDAHAHSHPILFRCFI